MSGFWHKAPKWLDMAAGVTILIILVMFKILWGMFLVPAAIGVVIIGQVAMFSLVAQFAIKYEHSISKKMIIGLWSFCSILIILLFLMNIESELFWWWPVISFALMCVELFFISLFFIAEKK